MEREKLKNRINELAKGYSADFTALALDIFDYQIKYCKVYSDWANQFSAHQPTELHDIPKLHISAYKHEKVSSGDYPIAQEFTSSGTTSMTTSSHHVVDVDSYLQNTEDGFRHFYGDVREYCVLGLLPSYMEREGSSLLAMVNSWISNSKHEQSGIFLHDHKELLRILVSNRERKIPTILIGVSFGLLDFIEHYQLHFPELIVMETGGMKGRRTEMTKTTLHSLLKKGFGVDTIHSEYGMTELLSQAYSKGDGVFQPSQTMKVFITEINDPLTRTKYGKAGIMNIIDLANLDSCSFISTEDIGIAYEDGSFEILGRLDHSDLRGCNLMVSDL